MKYLIVLSLICFFFTSQLHSQVQKKLETSIGVGWINSNAKPIHLNEYYTSKIFIHPQLSIFLPIARKQELGLEFGFYERRSKFDCVYYPKNTDPVLSLDPIVDSKEFGCSHEVNVKSRYISPKLIYNYYLFSKTKTSLYIGTYVGLLFPINRNEKRINLADLSIENNNSFPVFEITKSNINVGLHLGAQHKLNDKLYLNLKLSAGQEASIFDQFLNEYIFSADVGMGWYL